MGDNEKPEVVHAPIKPEAPKEIKSQTRTAPAHTADLLKVLERITGDPDRAAPIPYPKKMNDGELKQQLDIAAETERWLVMVFSVAPDPADPGRQRITLFRKHSLGFPIEDYPAVIDLVKRNLAEDVQARIKKLEGMADGSVALGVQETEEDKP